ncbi:3-phosphoshikimate 1-carboxyvinyltransferase [Alteromonas sp. ZYF713]|nr:3-phosphoshikimate 1-carboxyvinyltransferase [Alteromonas sp. ZYF713]
MPAEIAASYTQEQLLHLDEALRKNKAILPVNMKGRVSVPFTTTRFFWVFLAGRDKRELSRGEINVKKTTLIALIAGAITVSTLMGLLILYLIKSALGINIFEHFSLGIWGWFKQNVL